jgi:tetratricopeptide (TPR) repeat protein
MKGIRRDPVVLWLCSFLLLGVSLPGGVTAANRAVDLKVIGSAEGRTRVALLLQEKPRFHLSWSGGNHVALALYETAGGAAFAKVIAREGKSIRVEEESATRTLKMTIFLKTSLREAECSWIAKEKVLLIDMAQAKEPQRTMQKKSIPPTLKNLRFGTGEGFTRMVADLSAKPAWSMTSRDDQSLVFQLGATSTGIQRSGYGPMRRLKAVSLSKQKEGLEIKAEPEGPVERVKVFWLREGGRWVVDFFERGLETADSSVRFERRADPAVEKAPPPRVAEARKETDSSGKAATTEGKREEGVPGISSPLTSSMIRIKIENPAVVDTDAGGKAVHDPKFRPEPKVRYDHPVSLPEGPRVSNLRPGEAFLYGRIRESLEVKDYEKAAGLIDEFLSGFPDSSLAEEMFFLSGDCRFAMLERGEKRLYPKVVNLYQEAISRYPKSEKAPEALIKMARAHDLAGNDNEAIGFLSVAINQFGSGNHVPGALVARGRIYLRMSKPQRAIEDFKAVIDRFPDSPLVQEARYGTAGYYHGVGMYDDAERNLKEIAESNPGFCLEHPEFLFLRARNYFYKKNYDLAREQYFRALNLGHQPETGDLLISHIGDTYLHQTREKEAEILYRVAVEYFPESEGAGIAKLRIADQFSGVTAYEEVYQQNLNKPIGDLALLEMAGKFYKKGQYGLAVETIKKLTGKSVQSDVQREANHLFFRCAEKEIRGHYDAGRFKKVTEYFQSSDPGLSGNIDPEAMMLIGDSFYRGQQFAEAVRVFSQITARELNPASRGKYVIDFARSYLSLGDEENARTLLENASGEKLPAPDQQRAGLLLAEMCRKKGDLNRASDLLHSLLDEKRLLSDREMAGVYLGIGEISNKQGLYEKARDALNRSIALAEKDRESRELLRSAYVEMGNSYHFEERHKEAIRHYGQSLEMDYSPETNGFWEVKYRLALSYLGAGESGLASRLMNEIMEEGDPALQQKVQMKMGFIPLEKELRRLPLGKKGEESTL